MPSERSGLHTDLWLRVFLAVAEAESITAGAEVLNLSQPTASQYVRQLEEALGVKLLDRHGRGVSLTHAGVRLQQRAGAAYAAIDNILGEVSREEGVVRGTVRLASVHTINAYFLPPVLAEFARRRPEAAFQIFCRGSSDVVSLVERGRADVGLVYDSMVASTELHALTLFQERMALIHRAEQTVSTDEQGSAVVDRGLPVIAFPIGYALRQLLARYYSDRLDIVAEVDTMDTMLQLVRAGAGNAILPDRLPEEIIEAVGLCRTPLAEPVPLRRVVAIRRCANVQTPLVQFMETLVREHAGLLSTGPEIPAQ